MRGVLFNLPGVVDVVRSALDPALADRLELVGGDFFQSVPHGGDAYILKNILHDWADDRARAILQTCRRDMPSTAVLLVIEYLVCGPNESCYGKLMDIQMMVRNGGRNRTAAEFRDLLESAGFDLVEVVATAGRPSVLRCTRS